jgi:hypothetical protein
MGERFLVAEAYYAGRASVKRVGLAIWASPANEKALDAVAGTAIAALE